MRNATVKLQDTAITYTVYEVWVRGLGGFTRDRAFVNDQEAEAHARAWSAKGDIARVYRVEMQLLWTFRPAIPEDGRVAANDNE